MRVKKVFSTEYLSTFLSSSGIALFSMGGFIDGNAATVFITALMASYALSRAIAKRGQDMTYTGFQSREFHCVLAIVGWAFIAFTNNLANPLYLGGSIALIVSLYNIVRGLVKGRVIRGTTQVLRV